MSYNSKTHNRRSIRLKDYDYSQAGLYFVTICVHNRECLFGEIADGHISLSNIGTIADLLWFEIKNHAPNVELCEFVVMPNHIHGIIEIKDLPSVGALHATPLHATHPQPDEPCKQKNEYMAAISPKAGTLSTIIRSYKSAVSRHAHRLGYIFAWQRSFHEHIIRDNNDHARIAEYIKNNPDMWTDDCFYKE